MSMTNNGGDTGANPASPLFASSWMALYFLLKQELESLRAQGAEAACNDGEQPPNASED